MKIDRLLGITLYLLNHGQATAANLAGEFEVSQRTIYRDIETLCQAGIPVVSLQGFGGGLGIPEKYKVDRQVFSEDEIASIIAALKGVKTALIDEKVGLAIEKFKNFLPAETKKQPKRDRIIIDFNPGGFDTTLKRKLNLIKSALDSNRIIAFTYRNSRSQESRRRIEPLVLSFQGFAWYLSGFCRSRNDYRLFRLSRISDIEITDETFDDTLREDADYTWAQSWNPVSVVNLVLKFDPEVRYRLDDYFQSGNLIVNDDGTLTGRISFPEDEWVIGFILSFGSHVEVLEPQHIRGRIAEIGRTINRKNSNPV